MLNNNTYSSFSLLIPFILFNIFAMEKEEKIREEGVLTHLEATPPTTNTIHIINRNTFKIKRIDSKFDIKNFHQHLINQKAFQAFNTSHNNSFFGNSPKQSAIFKKIERIMTKEEGFYTFEKMMKSIMLVHHAKVNDESITKFNRNRNAININGKSQKYDADYKIMMWPDEKNSDAQESTETKYKDMIPAQAVVILSPYLQWDKKQQNLNETEKEFATIFTHATDFSHKKSVDCKNYIENTNDDETEKASKQKALEEKITEIMETIIIAAIRATPKDKIPHLRIPKIGLGCFCTFYNNRKKLVYTYMHALAEVMKKYTENNEIYVSLYNFIDKNASSDEKNIGDYYLEAFTEYFTKSNQKYVFLHKEKNGKQPSLFDKNLIHELLQGKNNILEILVNPGDAGSCFGNGGYDDNSLESCFLGRNNNDFLGFAHILNFMLSPLCKSTTEEYYNPTQIEKKIEKIKKERKKIEEEEIETIEEKIEEEEKEKIKKEKEKKIAIIIGLIVSIVASYAAKEYIEKTVQAINAPRMVYYSLRFLMHAIIVASGYAIPSLLLNMHHRKNK